MKNMGRLAVMGVLSLSLVACVGNNATSAASSAATSAATSTATSTATSAATSVASTVETAPAATTVVGTWKLAAMDQNGVLMGGDLGAVLSMMGMTDESTGTGSLMELTLADGGTGTFSYLGETHDVTWKETATGADMTPVATDDNPEPDTVPLTLEKDGLYMSMDGNTAIFTADGSYAGLEEYNLSAAKDVTSEQELIGTWKASGVDLMGATVKGDSAALAEQFGMEDVTFAAGGKCTLYGEECTYTVGTDGASLDMEGITVPLKMLNGELVLDMSSAFGAEYAMVYAKA